MKRLSAAHSVLNPMLLIGLQRILLPLLASLVLFLPIALLFSSSD